jgi:mycothiol S-conjugate amidase
MLVPDEMITTRVDISPVIEAKWRALQHHVTQMAPDNPFIQFGLDGWREFWAQETYILRESRVESALPETDLFAGLGQGAGARGGAPRLAIYSSGECQS